MDAVGPWRTPGIRSEVSPSVRPTNQGQEESATKKSTVRYQERPPCLTALEQRKKKSCQVPKDESNNKARVTIREEHLCLQGSNMIESRRKRVPEVRDSSRRGSRIEMSGWVFPWGSNKSVLFTIISSGRSCHSLANQQGACQRPAATKQAHVQQLVVLQAPWAAENEQQPCMMPVPSADGCRQVTSAESESMTYSYYLSEMSK